jgi:hypothetical protein
VGAVIIVVIVETLWMRLKRFSPTRFQQRASANADLGRTVQSTLLILPEFDSVRNWTTKVFLRQFTQNEDCPFGTTSLAFDYNAIANSPDTHRKPVSTFWIIPASLGPVSDTHVAGYPRAA